MRLIRYLDPCIFTHTRILYVNRTNITLAAVGDDAGPSAVMTTQLPRLP